MTPAAVTQTNLPAHPRHIVWLRPDSMGDGILASSMLEPLHAAHPQAKLSIVCRAGMEGLYQACPFVDQVLPVALDRIEPDAEYRAQLLAQLRTLEADWCLHSVYSRTPLGDWMAFAIPATAHIAFASPPDNIHPLDLERNNARYTHLVMSGPAWAPELTRHELFLQGLGIVPPKPLRPTVWTSPEDEAVIDRLVSELSLDPANTVALFAGAGTFHRRYLGYGPVLGPICRERGLSLVAVGSAEDGPTNQANLDAAGVDRAVNLCGKLTLTQSAALLRRCRLGVGAETGPAHMACAVGLPNVVLLGGGHFGRFMPYDGLTTAVSLPLDCFGCNWRCPHATLPCVQDIDTRVLDAAIREGLAGASAVPRLFIPRRAPRSTRAAGPQYQIKLELLAGQVVAIREVDLVEAASDTDVTAASLAAAPVREALKQVLEHAQKLAMTGHLPQALGRMEALAALETELAEVRNTMGAIRYRCGDHSNAERHFSRAVLLDPDNAVARDNLAAMAGRN